MQTDLKKIISISGHSGLYRYLSQGRSGIIVESLKDGKRTAIPKSTRISSLSDITIYTEMDEDMSIRDVLLKIKEHSGGTPVLSHKSSPDELTAHFASVIPEYDKTRVYTWHIVKITEWYNILLAHDMIDFEETKTDEPADGTASPESDTNSEETKTDKPADREVAPENKSDEAKAE